jgi:hypothetical protein
LFFAILRVSIIKNENSFLNVKRRWVEALPRTLCKVSLGAAVAGLVTCNLLELNFVIAIMTDKTFNHYPPP